MRGEEPGVRCAVTHLCVRLGGGCLDGSGHLDGSSVSSGVGRMGGGEGVELCVCMSVCSFRPWELARGREGKRAKPLNGVLYLGGSCSESPSSSTVNWECGGWVLGNKSCMRTIFKRLMLN